MKINKIQFISSLRDVERDPCPTCILNNCTRYSIIKSIKHKDSGFVWCNRIRDSD